MTVPKRKGPKPTPFALARGYLVLPEISTQYKVTPSKLPADLKALSKAAEHRRKHAYYVLQKHAVSLPFGGHGAWFTQDGDLAAIVEAFGELQRVAAEINAVAQGLFVLRINYTVVKPDYTDENFRLRIIDFVLDKLSDLRERLTSFDPSVLRATLAYTQDPLKRLDLLCTGDYAVRLNDTVRISARKAKEVQENPEAVRDKDLSYLDGTVEMFKRARG